jgi:lipid A disaccharide synthetase
MLNSADIVILSNGPGELTTWVYPVLRELGKSLDRNQDLNARISVVLSPCTNASGQEAAIAQKYPGVDRVLPPEHFWQFLLWHKTPDPSWDWYDKGVVIFLGGDQIFPVAIGKRLGYQTIIYAEWEARWHGWIDHFAVRNESVAAKIPQKFQYKTEIVGDLMVDRQVALSTVGTHELNTDQQLNTDQLVVFMPGSKAMKLGQGVPLCLGICDLLKRKIPDLKMAIALAPTITPQYLAKFAQPNPVVAMVEGTTAELVESASGFMLQTPAGTDVEIYTQFPAHDLLQQCQVCVTTVGANTAELAGLGVPMIVLLPTNQLDAMRSWDGILGILANLPIVGDGMAKVINHWMLNRIKLAAWPNIWADREIVPELLGHLTPASVTERICDLLDHPEKLQLIRDRLREVCGRSGAAAKIATIAINALADSSMPNKSQ